MQKLDKNYSAFSDMIASLCTFLLPFRVMSQFLHLQVTALFQCYMRNEEIMQITSPLNCNVMSLRRN